MKIKHIIFNAWILWMCSTFVHAQELQFSGNLHQGWSFIENRGQLADESNQLLTDIKYYGIDKGVNIYFRQSSLSFVFSHSKAKKQHTKIEAQPELPTRPEPVEVDFTRMEMHFIGSNPKAQIIPTQQKEEYLNFYLAHTPEEGIRNIKIFNKLTYKDLYPGIDLILYVQEKGLKYEFVIHPGGNPKDIKIKWEGTTPELMPDGGMRYNHSIATLIESKPLTFYSDGHAIKSRFKMDDSKFITFEIEKYQTNQTIIIDPSINWGTYYGGNDDEAGADVVSDAAGNIYQVGSTASYSGIATTGAFQTSMAGAYDVFLAKFNSNGARIWATYYGGSVDDYAYAIAIDTATNVVISCITSSYGMATSGAYQTTFAGSTDGLFAKFNKNGSRLWSTYFGGSGGETALAVQLDISGDAYFSGVTSSATGISTSGAFQTTFGGNTDAYLAKFDKNGKIYWSTYFGGSDIDNGYDLILDDSAYLYLAGRTRSTSGIATSGAFQTSFGGTNDAFLACFNKNGNRVWATYFGGSDSEWAYAITSDKNGGLLITGFTQSTSGIATSGAHQTSHSGFADAFLAKFNKAGQRIWATYYGGSGNDCTYAASADPEGVFYITGYTSSTSGIATGGSYQTSNGGANDAFIAQFNNAGKLSKATYFGGSGYEEGTGISGSGSKIVITGSTTSNSKIATSGSHQTTYAGVQDGYIASFKFCVDTDTTLFKEACDSFILNGVVYRIGGTWIQKRKNAANCDSTITLKLKILKTSFQMNMTACDSLTLNDQTYFESGSYTQKLKNKAGCDSTIMLKLTINKDTDTSLSVSACNHFVLNQDTFFSSGTYYQNRLNFRGCDSLITLQLTLRSSTDTLIEHTACNRFILNGITYDQSGTYNQILTNHSGCDSNIVLNLTILDSSSFSYSETACDSMEVNGETYYTSGTYMQTLQNANGCDSMLTIRLNILKSSHEDLNISSCGPYLLNGTTYHVSGKYDQNIKNIAGCDSFITLNLTVNSYPDARFNASIDKNKVTFTPLEMNAKSYSWDFGNSYTSTDKAPVFTYPNIGNYKVVLKVVSMDDCNNQHDTTLTVSGLGWSEKWSKNQIKIYPNPSKGEVVIEGISDDALITFIDIAGKVIKPNQVSDQNSVNISGLKAGVYFIRIEDHAQQFHAKLMVE